MKKWWKPTVNSLFASMIAFLLSLVGLSVFLYIWILPGKEVLVAVSAAFLSLFFLYLFFSLFAIVHGYLRKVGGLKKGFKLYRADKKTRRDIHAFLSACYAFLFGLAQFGMATAESSSFLLSVSVIAFLISLSKFYLLSHSNEGNAERRKTLFLFSGFYFVIAIAIASMTSLLWGRDGDFAYSIYQCLINGTYTFTLLGFTISSTVQSLKSKDGENLLFLSVRHVNTVYSMFVLTISFLNSFSKNPESEKNFMVLVGTIGALLILGYSFALLFLACKKKAVSTR